MIYAEDPFRRRPRKLTEKRKEQERYAWMTENLGKRSAEYSQITKNELSDGYEGKLF